MSTVAPVENLPDVSLPKTGNAGYTVCVRIIATSTLKAFYENRQQGAEQAIKVWIAVARQAGWKTPSDAKASFPAADILPDGRMIFDLGGNKYRLVAKINYRAGIVYVRFIGTHRAYDKIDATTV